MELKNQLYTISDRRTDGDATIFSIALNPECFIYKAHFPENPITPGVCIVQTACELLGEIIGKRLEISQAKDIKFINILSPVKNQNVDVVFENVTKEEDDVKAKVTVKAGEAVFATISFTCASLLS